MFVKVQLMTTNQPAAPKRFKIARFWQWPAFAACALFLLSCFVGWPLGVFWPSAVGLFLFIPAAALFNIKCHACGYPAFSDFQADERLRNDNRFWTRFWGKEYGGVHLPLRSECSKCGVSFVHKDT
jgi:fatty-acid desaturase